MTHAGPALSERGQQAKALLAEIEVATGAEALALAVLRGDIKPPKGSAGHDDQ